MVGAPRDLLRVLLCGSVDDGKSTLIGRLLCDAGLLPQDRLEELSRESARHGCAEGSGGEWDPSLVADGLKAEREQGITIDVAHLYFATALRKFIVADAPGHEQYTRNMVTGASRSDLAILLVDVLRGITTQTRRHAAIAGLLGLRHLIVAVNKMDLVDYRPEPFEALRRQFTDFAGRLDIPDIRFVPLSALRGDQVVRPSANMPWYGGGTLMHLLETVHIASDRNLIDLRFPVQYVNRLGGRERGYAGTVASGIIRPGDEVVVLPGGRRTRVRSLLTFAGEVAQATPPTAVTVTLTDEVDVARGDLIVHPQNQPECSGLFEAMLVWLADRPLEPGRPVLLRQTTRLVPARVQALRYRLDLADFKRGPATGLEPNGIGRAVIATDGPLPLDPYQKNRRTGSFILIDRLTHDTLAAGMAIARLSEKQLHDERRSREAPARQARLEQEPAAVSAAQREALLGQRALTIWFTGLSGAGKSSLARWLEERLHAQGRLAYTLDGDRVRGGLNRDLGFSAEDRTENIRRIAEVCRLLNDAGLVVLVPVIAPFRADRAAARAIIGPQRFFELYLATPIQVCESRDAKGLYARARAGELHEFTGISSPYEPPQAPDLALDTSSAPLEECGRKLLEAMAGRMTPA